MNAGKIATWALAAVCALGSFYLRVSPGQAKATSGTGAKEVTIIAAQPDDATRVGVSKTYGRLLLHFEANQGQVDEEVRFLSSGSGYSLFLTSTEAVLVLGKPRREYACTVNGPFALRPQRTEETDATVLRMRLIGANSSPEVVGLDELPGKANYFKGNDPDKWHTNVPTYAKVEYSNIYPGIDLTYYGNQRQLEYDFVVAPGSDSGIIRLAFEGADEMILDNEGNLILKTKGGGVTLRAPVVYQEEGGARRGISARYVLEGENQVDFQVAAYDPAKPLVIDPVVVYSTYLGGGENDGGSGIAVDSSGSAYVASTAYSADFPTASAIQGASAGLGDAFVVKIQTLCQADPDCDDTNACTTDICDPNDPGANPAGCVYTAVDCNDGNLCTDDSCNPATGCELRQQH